MIEKFAINYGFFVLAATVMVCVLGWRAKFNVKYFRNGLCFGAISVVGIILFTGIFIVKDQFITVAAFGAIEGSILCLASFFIAIKSVLYGIDVKAVLGEYQAPTTKKGCVAEDKFVIEIQKIKDQEKYFCIGLTTAMAISGLMLALFAAF